MLHKLLEKWSDTFLYLTVLSGLMVVWLCFWKGQYQLRYAELVMQEFLTQTAVDGMVTLEAYEIFEKKISAVNQDYKVNMLCRTYSLQPSYAYVPREKIAEYYMERNVKKNISLPDCKICLVEDDESLLQLQTETNATIMAAEQQEYLPLPEATTEWSIQAVRPSQEVYEGEELITVCYVASESGGCYVEADSMTAVNSGVVFLQLSLGEEKHAVPVEVLCHPRKILCERGHRFVNTKEILEESKKTGKTKCPYCIYLPEVVTCNVTILQKRTGTGLRKEELWITAMYPDGKTEQVTPESEEWADNYDKNYCGIQNVTVRYRSKEATVTVVSENESCRQCGTACNERCYMDFISFPYCITCMSRVPLFTGKVYEEEQWIEQSDLLMEGREILLHRGDFITLQLLYKGQGASLLQKEVMQDGRRNME